MKSWAGEELPKITQQPAVDVTAGDIFILRDYRVIKGEIEKKSQVD